jgi:alanine racemase
MMSRGWMEVDLGALVRNAEALRQRAGVPLIPMVKADAYGLGAVEVARALGAVEPIAFGVATVAEGVELRSARIEQDIIVFTPVLHSEFPLMREARLTPTLGFPESIRAWAELRGPYVLSIDSGMARAGIPWRQASEVRDLVSAHPPVAAFTHYHSADRDDGSMDVQDARFREALSMLPAVPSLVHTDASAAIVRHAKSPWQAIRPGIFMYGVGSGEGAGQQPECVVQVKAPIVEIRDVQPGDSVSYEAAWTASSRRRIATISLGYADGYPRNAGKGGVGVLKGGTAPIVGRVTMDMIMLDVTDVGAEVGDVVTVIGDARATGAPIDVESIGKLAGMSPYEVLTGLRGRLVRTYRAAQ